MTFLISLLLLWSGSAGGIHVSKDGSVSAHGQALIDKNGKAASSSLVCGMPDAGLLTGNEKVRAESLRPVATIALIYGDGSVYAGDRKNMSGGGTLVIDHDGKIVDQQLLHSTLKELTGPNIQCSSAPMAGHVVCARVS